MFGMVSWFARNAVAANLLMVVAFIGGVLGFNQMEREMFPVVPVAGASVTMTWQGASPQDVEEQIITRIEEAVADIDGLDRITSIARESFAVVNIRGRDDIDMKVFIDEIKLRVDQINNLPQAAFQPQVTRWEQRDRYFGMAIHGDVDALTLKRVADDVRDDIAEISGGELAIIQAVLDEEVSIEISEEALRRFNLSFSEIAQAVRQSSLNSSGGQKNSSRISLFANRTIRARSELAMLLKLLMALSMPILARPIMVGQPRSSWSCSQIEWILSNMRRTFANISIAQTIR